ncbi:hypothetical protein RRG08_007830 [Elysia crispata]|uniref:Uncharacterized protein n=1 Tax=Elysia crispata TaxID=231223 RepID=A0AAE1CN62_9GAST|nr:hypothetical protein RRG08_007830 [Elysia crispata]
MTRRHTRRGVSPLTPQRSFFPLSGPIFPPKAEPFLRMTLHALLNHSGNSWGVGRGKWSSYRWLSVVSAAAVSPEFPVS